MEGSEVLPALALANKVFLRPLSEALPIIVAAVVSVTLKRDQVKPLAEEL